MVFGLTITVWLHNARLKVFRELYSACDSIEVYAGCACTAVRVVCSACFNFRLEIRQLISVVLVVASSWQGDYRFSLKGE